MIFIIERIYRFKNLLKYCIGIIYYMIHYNECNPIIDYSKIKKVIFVAHPDDEIIFFSKSILNKSDCLIVCFTNGGIRTRQREFISLMKDLNIQYKILNFRDGMNVKWNYKKAIKFIKNILNKKEKWQMIITHNDEGEYGHFQHKQLNELVYKSCNNQKIYIVKANSTLFCEKNKLSDEKYIEKINIVRQYYKSQNVDKHLNRYFKYEGLTKKTIYY